MRVMFRVCCLHQSQHMWPPQPLNLYFKSYFSLSFKMQQTGSPGQSTESGVMRNDRTGRGKISEQGTLFLWFLVLLLRGPHVSSAPVSSSRPSQPAYPCWNTASNSPGSLLSRTECRCMSQRRLCATSRTHDGKV